jgi:hypothetical protein
MRNGEAKTSLRALAAYGTCTTTFGSLAEGRTQRWTRPVPQ